MINMDTKRLNLSVMNGPSWVQNQLSTTVYEFTS